MDAKEQTLDLTGLHWGNFKGKIRLRNLVDWAEDYFAQGYVLTRVKMTRDIYKSLMEEVVGDNRYLRRSPDDKVDMINLGHGNVELVWKKV